MAAADLDDLRQQRDRWRALRTVPRAGRVRRAQVGEPALLPAVPLDTWCLHVQLARRGDPAVREALVAQYQPHARALARRFHRHREPLDDLVQVALEALVLALNRFDPDRSTPFVGFANPTIIGSLKRYYRDAGWAVRVPRRVHELSRPIRETSDVLAQDLGRAPTADEIADFLGLDPGVVDEAMVAGAARAVSPLDAPTGSGTGTGPGERALGQHDPSLRRVEDRATLRALLEPLDDDDRLLLHRYFVEGMTQSEIAVLEGVSQMQVSRNLSRLLRRMRSHL